MKDENHALYTKADKLIKEGKKDEAISILKELVDKEEYAFIIKYQLAKLYLEKKETEALGVELLEKLSHEYGNLQAILLLGRYYASVDRNEDAFNELKKTINTKIEKYGVYEIGKLFLKEGNLVEAKKSFQYVVSKNEDVFSLFELGKIAIDENNLKEAREYFEKALKIKFDIYTYFYLGKLEVLENSLEEATDIFYEILEINPNDIYSMIELGKIEVNKGNTIKARELFNKILKIKSDDVPTLYELGKLDEREGYYKKAKERFNKILEIKPNDIMTKLELGDLSICEGDNKKASIIFKKLIDEYDYDIAKIHYANLLCMEGNFKEAREICEKILDTKELYNAKLTIGRTYALEGDFISARKIFNDLISNHIDDYAYFELVYLLIQENKFEEAYETLNEMPLIFRKLSLYLNLETYLEYHLGIDIDPEWLDVTYFGSQLHEYSYEKLLNHILNHDSIDKTYYADFNSSVDLYSLIGEVLDKKKELAPTQRFLLDKYIIECDDIIAKMEGEDIKHVVINVLPNSDKIISMYPVRISENGLIKNKLLVKE